MHSGLNVKLRAPYREQDLLTSLSFTNEKKCSGKCFPLKNDGGGAPCQTKTLC